MRTGHLRLLAAALASAALLLGCGGGGGAPGPRENISRVTVAGDSLADVGTFGFKFTVQNSADPAAGFPVFPELVAESFGISGQCNFFVATSATTFATDTACTNFAVGGAKIFNKAADGGQASPGSVQFQLATALQARGGAWADTDLVLVDGGPNDLNDLVSAFLGAAQGNVAGYQAFLLQQVDPATLAATLPQPNGAALAGGVYMQRLADTYYNTIKANTLDHGATHVAVLDMPDLTLTPRVRAVLASVALANGGGAAGDTAAATLQAAIRSWVNAFNTQLQARVGGDERVALVPLNADFSDQIANFPTYGLSNVLTPACPRVGVSGTGIPLYDIDSCTSAALDAAPPAGLSAGWWQTFAFADDLHPTPFGQRLLAASVNRALARAGWL